MCCNQCFSCHVAQLQFSFLSLEIEFNAVRFYQLCNSQAPLNFDHTEYTSETRKLGPQRIVVKKFQSKLATSFSVIVYFQNPRDHQQSGFLLRGERGVTPKPLLPPPPKKLCCPSKILKKNNRNNGLLFQKQCPIVFCPPLKFFWQKASSELSV